MFVSFTLYSESIGGLKGVGIKNNSNSHFNIIFPAGQATYDVVITEHQLYLTSNFALQKKKRNIYQNIRMISEGSCDVTKKIAYIYINDLKYSDRKQLF